jgi:hypothetical protein
MNSCKNCNEPVLLNYCSNCGQPAKLKRIDMRYIIQEIASVFNAERGLLYTTQRMLTSPGESTMHYITEDRSRYVKPTTFLIVTSLIYTIASHFLHFDSKEFYMQQTEIEFPTVNLFINWMIDYNGYMSIISGLFIALWVKLFFRKSQYNLFEIFTLICFISGISSLFFSVVIILQRLTHLRLVHISLLIVIIYYAWAIGQFFDKKKAANYIKAFLSCILGVYLLGFLITIVAIFIDIM